MKKFVSIIIPTYNEEKNLESTLKAIRNQDYKKYEIIVSDSRSKDRTREIAKKYRTKVVVDKKKGIGAGRNFGARFAKGEILLFVDADTVLMENNVSEIVKSFSKTKVVGVTCPIFPSKPNTKNLGIYLTYNQLVKSSIITHRPQVGGMCMALRKKSFLDVGGFDESIATFEDLDISLRISRIGKFVFNENTFAVTSPRRVEAWGHFASFKKYLRFYLKYLVGLKIKPDEYKPVR